MLRIRFDRARCLATAVPYGAGRQNGARARTGSSSDQSPCSISCPFGNGGRGSRPKRQHHPIVAVVTKQHDPREHGDTGVTLGAQRRRHVRAAHGVQRGERSAGQRPQSRQRGAYLAPRPVRYCRRYPRRSSRHPRRERRISCSAERSYPRGNENPPSRRRSMSARFIAASIVEQGCQALLDAIGDV